MDGGRTLLAVRVRSRTPVAQQAPAQSPTAPARAQRLAKASAGEPYRAVVNTYCLSCHNSKTKAGGLGLENSINASRWAITGTHGKKSFASFGRARCPRRARDSPIKRLMLPHWRRWRPRSTASRRQLLIRDALIRSGRLNRTEYHNAIRDLLALELDTASMLPSDSASYGFDNVTVGNLSPTLLESYVSAAEKISRLAVGRPSLSLGGPTVRIRPDITQEKHIEGLPIGTRGGALVEHEFPLNGEYDITIRLARDRNEHVEGLLEPHEIELMLDGERLNLFKIEPTADGAATCQPPMPPLTRTSTTI